MILAPHRVTDKNQRQQAKTKILPPHNLAGIKLKGPVHQTGFKLYCIVLYCINALQ